ncbi:GH92 family glycosyl hydrolase [Gabonibacter chumensis]|uniref:GH92 family glycosyl hydrolase n=1 Tax=Gabonibacter chumensis TaxID=2972474 RepID=UPI002573A1E3|nr:GH92 family glycosyl hydrolase [Gabonibacter chumensis]MCR9011724.1 GH92 family glycosyl hydrolase [Gabonibacter chumensis]
MKTNLLLLSFLYLLINTSCTREREIPITDLVNPFIGTNGQGGCFPGAAYPFGMIQLGPNTVNASGEQGYTYKDSVISAFSFIHPGNPTMEKHPGIKILPTVKKPHPGENAMHFIRSCYAGFSHRDEQAEPGYYSVTFKNGIKTESSVTERCGIQYYQFPTAANYGLVLDMITPREEEGSQETSIKKVDNRSIQGYRKYIKDNQTRRIYFFIQFSQDVNVWVGNDSLRPLANGKRITLPQSYAWIDFGQITNKIIAKISISSANSDGAIANLNKEIPHWSFDKVKRDAKQQWRRTLSRIRIKTDSSETAKIFYTALYHAYLTPPVYSDVHGNYTGVDGEVHSVGKGIQYKLAPLQYTCWTQYPLLTITQREKANEIIQSLLIHYDQTGILPRGIIPQRAIGNPAISVITGSYLKGIRNFDIEKAYEAIKATLTNPSPEINALRRYHFIPGELTEHSVLKSLTHAYDNWCAAQMAKALNKEDDYLFFIQSSRNYEQLFDTATGWVEEKDKQCRFKQTDESRKNTWFIPHEIERLINIQGGKQFFISRLDNLYTSKDSTLYYEQAYGPLQHTPYLFSYAGVPTKTQYHVSQIRKLYSDTPEGLPGNDNYGQLSAWYVFSAIGFYPVNPCDGKYRLGTPLFNKVILKLGQDRRFIIKANKENDRYIYVKKVLLNGTPLKHPWITHEEILRGGELEFILTDQPTTNL